MKCHYCVAALVFERLKYKTCRHKIIFGSVQILCRRSVEEVDGRSYTLAEEATLNEVINAASQNVTTLTQCNKSCK